MKHKKKVCIVTWYGTPNYGSNLQAYGLLSALEKMGYDVSFLGSFKVKPFIFMHPRMMYARLINRLNSRKRKEFFVPVPYEINAVRKKRLMEFKNKTFKIQDFKTNQQWKKALKEKTIFIAGSDIIWNPALGYPAARFLDFAYYAKLSRMSYASSVGALKLPKKYYKAYKRYIGTMKAVGVREQSVKDMLEPIINREIKQVVDPSLLLTADEWLAFSEMAKISVSVSENGYIVCYFVMNDQRYWDYISIVAQTYKKQIIVLPMHKADEQKPYDILLDGTPPEFVKLIKNADFICTDSFHACVFSSLFNKEFYLLRRMREAENAKYDDFLNKYGLSDRIVLDESVFVLKPKTDYTLFNSLIKKDREFAMSFLKSALKESEGIM